MSERARGWHGYFAESGTMRERFEAGYTPEPNTGCWLWIGAQQRGGYGCFWDGKKNGGAHRMSWRLSRGEIPGGLMVLHHCDVPRCVNPDHLFLGTAYDNAHDMVRKGRHGGTILTQADRSEIRRSKEKTGDLMRRFGVARAAIKAIRQGRVTELEAELARHAEVVAKVRALLSGAASDASSPAASARFSASDRISAALALLPEVES